MNKDVRDAVRTLAWAYQMVEFSNDLTSIQRLEGQMTLARAIRHLAYPDRDTYPKTRRATKGAPIVRR